MVRALERILKELGAGTYSLLRVKDCYRLCVSVISHSCSASSSCGLTNVRCFRSRDRLGDYLQGRLWGPGRWGTSLVSRWLPCLFTSRGHCSKQVWGSTRLQTLVSVVVQSFGLSTGLQLKVRYWGGCCLCRPWQLGLGKALSATTKSVVGRESSVS